MPFVTVFVEQTDIDEAVARVISQFGPEVVHVNYNMGLDTSDEPCIRFRFSPMKPRSWTS